MLVHSIRPVHLFASWRQQNRRLIDNGRVIRACLAQCPLMARELSVMHSRPLWNAMDEKVKGQPGKMDESE